LASVGSAVNSNSPVSFPAASFFARPIGLPSLDQAVAVPVVGSRTIDTPAPIGARGAIRPEV
jgi:hypothetical protein